jgi:hypothetical protein
MLRFQPQLILFAALFAAFSYVHFSGNWNSNSRLDMILAIVENGNVAIDPYHVNTGDKALIDGHYYSEKPPALALLGVGPFLLARWFLTETPLESQPQLHGLILDWTTTVFTVGLITALGGVATFAMLRRFVPERVAWTVTLCLFLGTVVYVYTTMFFSHAAAAGLIAIGLWGALHDRRAVWIDAVAGLALGLAVACEFQTFLPALGVWIIILLSSWKQALRVALFAMPPFLLIPWYNWATSGSIFHFPSASHASFPDMAQGFVSMRLPSPRAAISMIISPYRGLLFWSPIFLLALAGFDRRILHSSSLLWTLALTPLAEVLFISSFPFWHGGQSLGPRYILSVVPLLAIPTAVGFSKFPRIGTIAAVLSILLAWGGMIAFPLALEMDAHPIVTMIDVLPMKFASFGAHMGTFLGWSNALGLLPLFALITVLAIWGYRILPSKP